LRLEHRPKTVLAQEGEGAIMSRFAPRIEEWTEKAKKAKNSKLLMQIFVCLYLCPGNCKTDPTCPWKKSTDAGSRGG